MRRCTFICIIILLFQVNLFGQKREIISVNCEDVTLSQLVDQIMASTDIKVFYEVSQFGDKRVTVNKDSASAFSILEIALRGSSLKVSRWNDNIVILEGVKLATDLPEYAFLAEKTDSTSIRELTITEKRYLQGRKSDVLRTLVIGNKNIQGNGKARIRGRITDFDTGEPIIGATIFIEETRAGAAADRQGYFTIILPRGKYHAQIASLGYETGKYQIEVFSSGLLDVELKNSPLYLEEAVIMGDRQMDITRKDPGLEKISIKSIKAVPMMLGERDIIKVSEMLPGIVSVGEGSSGLHVRGGSSDQNAFYINKIPVYNTSHLFGFFPAFNSDIIKDFSIYKGHVPAEYGGRLSSVFNIATRQGNKDQFGFRGGINPISANVTLEGPLVKEKSSVLLSARSSFSDWILSLINDPVLQSSSASFNDFSLYTDYQTDNSVLSLFLYASNDKFDLADLNRYRYHNRGGALNYHRVYKNLLRMDISFIMSGYGFTTTDNQNKSTAYSHSYKINHGEIRTDFTKTINERNELSFGFSGIHYGLDRGSVVPYNEESLRKQIDLGKERGIENAIYLSDKLDIRRWLTIDMGIRYALFTPIGRKTVYTYKTGLPRQAENIENTLTFSAGEPIKWYQSPELRIAANIKTDMNGSIKVSFNQMSQNLFMLNNTIAIAPNTQWKLADYHLAPSRSNQYSAGVFRNILNGTVETSLELYYRTTADYTEFKDGADFIDNPLIETAVLQGDHFSYGAELMLKKTQGRFNGWIAYTFSRSFVEITGEHAWEEINNGKRYPSNYDIPHVMNSVLNYQLSKRFTFSGVITYQTGKPVTYPVSVYYVDDIPVVDYYERNKYRLPYYFRTDLSLTIEGNLKKNKFAHSSWMFSIYNVTGRKNAYSVFFVSENGRMDSYKYSVVGIPFFTATWLFKFGNYATQ